MIIYKCILIISVINKNWDNVCLWEKRCKLSHLTTNICQVTIFLFCQINMACMLSWAWFCAIYLNLSYTASIIFKILNFVCQCDVSLAYVPIKMYYYYHYKCKIINEYRCRVKSVIRVKETSISDLLVIIWYILYRRIYIYAYYTYKLYNIRIYLFLIVSSQFIVVFTFSTVDNYFGLLFYCIFCIFSIEFVVEKSRNTHTHTHIYICIYIHMYMYTCIHACIYYVWNLL